MKLAISIVTVGLVVVLVLPLFLWLLDLRPGSPRSLFLAEVHRQQELLRSSGRPASPPITAADLTKLPPAVATFLVRAGVVGKPRPRSLHATFRARMRNRAEDAWMNATVEQHSFFGPTGAARLFFMKASRGGIPFVAYHRYVGDTATFQVRIAGLVKILDVQGPEMDQSETVTMLNDLFFLAPGALLDADIRWETQPDGRVKATFTNAGHTVSALVRFDAAGDLIDFVSEDRYQSDGKTSKRLPWSTPFSDHRDFGGTRLASRGEARWTEATGEWTYGEFVIERITYQ